MHGTASKQKRITGRTAIPRIRMHDPCDIRGRCDGVSRVFSLAGQSL
jgi:hypothetical protein